MPFHPTGGAQPKSSTTKPKAASQAGLRPRRGPEPVEYPMELIQVQIIQNQVLPRRWKSLGPVIENLWVNPVPPWCSNSPDGRPHPSSSPLPRKRHQAGERPMQLYHQDFLPCNNYPSTRDFQEKRKEETLALT